MLHLQSNPLALGGGANQETKPAAAFFSSTPSLACRHAACVSLLLSSPYAPSCNFIPDSKRRRAARIRR